MQNETPQKAELGYPYEFSINELAAAQACVEAHGFAVVKQMLPSDLVKELQASVLQLLDPQGELSTGMSRTLTSFMEVSHPMQKLLGYEPFMRSQQVFSKADALTLNRSAAIIRMPG